MNLKALENRFVGPKKLCTDYYFAYGTLLDQDDHRFRHFSYQNPQQTVFDLGSLTKALVTAPLCLQTAKTKQLDIKQKVRDWIGPKRDYFDLPHLDDIRICDLLSHRSGLPSWRNFWTNVLCENLNWGERQAVFYDRLSRIAVGDHSAKYSDVGYLVLGRILEVVWEKPLDQLLYDFCQEIGFSYTAERFGFPRPDHPVIDGSITTGWCQVREKERRGEVFDENCAALGGICGHAGLFADGDSLHEYLRCLFSHDSGLAMIQESARIFSQDTQADLGLGLQRANSDFSRVFGEGRALGHLGFTGTLFWLIPERFQYVILLTNRVISARVNPEIKTMRKEYLAYAAHELGLT